MTTTTHTELIRITELTVGDIVRTEAGRVRVTDAPVLIRRCEAIAFGDILDRQGADPDVLRAWADIIDGGRWTITGVESGHWNVER